MGGSGRGRHGAWKLIGGETGLAFTNVRTKPNLSATKHSRIMSGMVRKGTYHSPLGIPEGTGWIHWEDGGYSKYHDPATGKAMFRLEADTDHVSSSSGSSEAVGRVGLL